MPYLFQISIGPVQLFIKGARRTRDLKFGSLFLSEIAMTAAQTIRKTCGAESLIFPAFPFKTEDRPDNAPNKLLAYIDTSPESVAEETEKAIHERVQQLWTNVLQHIGNAVPFAQEQAEKQIGDLVEYMWVAVEYDENNPEESYVEALQQLETLMAARKNTRDFAPVTWANWQSREDSQLKSSIDGQLESVIPKNLYPQRHGPDPSSDKETQQKIKTLRKVFGAGPHERLSGVDLLKRLGPIASVASGETANPEEDTFPSTSHIAALPFLQALHSLPEGKLERTNRWKNGYLGILNKIDAFKPDILPKAYRGNIHWENIFVLGSYDGALLFPKRFPDVVGDARVYQDARSSFREAERVLENFYHDIGFHPDPYYVLLVADGDSMGKAINHQATHGMGHHKALSEALAHFATEVRTIIKRQMGVRIYSGGDDVLAMLPLHTAVDCARQLSQAFQERLKSFPDENGKSPTLSVGLAVVHHLHPLGDALEIARAAENRAKRGEKNALAITVQKRGGPPCMVGGRWDVFEPRLQRQIKLCQGGIVPAGMAYELEEIGLRLEPETEHGANQPISPPYVQYAALRVFQRKLDEAKRRGYSNSEISATLDLLKEMIGLEHIQPVSVGKLADELIVARLFADALLLAKGQSEGGKA